MSRILFDKRVVSHDIASLVDGLTKISEVMGSNTPKQAESFRKMILTLADDVRVILIKIADRLHNMRTLDSMPEHKQVKIASETLYIYAPLAHRMGLHAIKTELEDLSLKYENPVEYQELEKRIHTSLPAPKLYEYALVQKPRPLLSFDNALFNWHNMPPPLAN